MSESQADRWSLGYRPGLDGLRGVAVLLVLVNHTGLPYTGTAGTVGVNVFFVLSGFLITRLLLEERRTFGSVSLKHFYQRRILRIFPVMYLFLAVTAVVGWMFREPLNQVVFAGTYVSNFVRAGGNSMPLLPHTWSLAMEEQFYLVWPILLVVLLTWSLAPGNTAGTARRTITVVILGGVLLSFGARIALGVSGASLLRLHNGPEVAIGVLLVGCLLALWADRIPDSRFVGPAVFVVGLAAIVATSVGEKSVPFYLVWLPLAIGASVLVIAYLAKGDPRAWPRRGMAWAPLVYLGRISYGLYLWHYTVYYVVKKNVTVLPYKPMLQVSLSLVVAVVSYHFFEVAFLKLKDRMRQTEDEEAVTPPVCADCAVGSNEACSESPAPSQAPST